MKDINGFLCEKNVGFTYYDNDRILHYDISGKKPIKEIWREWIDEIFGSSHSDKWIFKNFKETSTLDATVHFYIADETLMEVARNKNYVLIDIDGFFKFYFIVKATVRNNHVIEYTLKLDTITTYFVYLKFKGSCKVERQFSDRLAIYNPEKNESKELSDITFTIPPEEAEEQATAEGGQVQDVEAGEVTTTTTTSISKSFPYFNYFPENPGLFNNDDFSYDLDDIESSKEGAEGYKNGTKIIEPEVDNEVNVFFLRLSFEIMEMFRYNSDGNDYQAKNGGVTVIYGETKPAKDLLDKNLWYDPILYNPKIIPEDRLNGQKLPFLTAITLKDDLNYDTYAIYGINKIVVPSWYDFEDGYEDTQAETIRAVAAGDIPPTKPLTNLTIQVLPGGYKLPKSSDSVGSSFNRVIGYWDDKTPIYLGMNYGTIVGVNQTKNTGSSYYENKFTRYKYKITSEVESWFDESELTTYLYSLQVYDNVADLYNDGKDIESWIDKPEETFRFSWDAPPRKWTTPYTSDFFVTNGINNITPLKEDKTPSPWSYISTYKNLFYNNSNLSFDKVLTTKNPDLEIKLYTPQFFKTMLIGFNGSKKEIDCRYLFPIYPTETMKFLTQIIMNPEKVLYYLHKEYATFNDTDTYNANIFMDNTYPIPAYSENYDTFQNEKLNTYNNSVNANRVQTSLNSASALINAGIFASVGGMVATTAASKVGALGMGLSGASTAASTITQGIYRGKELRAGVADTKRSISDSEFAVDYPEMQGYSKKQNRIQFHRLNKSNRDIVNQYYSKYGYMIGRIKSFGEIKDFISRTFFSYWEIADFIDNVDKTVNVPFEALVDISKRFQDGVRLWNYVPETKFNHFKNYDYENWEIPVYNWIKSNKKVKNA